MYLYGTSWEGGGASMCVLHSIAHARLMPPSSTNGSADPVSASGYEVAIPAPLCWPTAVFSPAPACTAIAFHELLRTDQSLRECEQPSL